MTSRLRSVNLLLSSRRSSREREPRPEAKVCEGIHRMDTLEGPTGVPTIRFENVGPAELSIEASHA